MTVTARFANVRRLALQAGADGVVPGAVILVSTEGQVVFREAFGKRALEPQPLPAAIDTLYAVASVTKAMVTSVLALQAADAAALRLVEPVRRLLPEFGDADGGDGKAAGTVRHLLAHAGGLPAHRPFYLTVPEGPERRLRIMQAAAREPLAGPPGVRALYTDLGFILLGWLLERAGGGRLDGQARQHIFAPLRLAACLFSPVGEAAAQAGPL